MENRKNSNTATLHLLGENIALGTYPPLALELPDPAAGGPACLDSSGMLSHQLLVALALRIPHESELLQGRGDWAIRVSQSENLGLSSSLENTFYPHSSAVITCSPSLLCEFEWNEGKEGGGRGARMETVLSISQSERLLPAAAWMLAAANGAFSMGRKLKTPLPRDS